MAKTATISSARLRVRSSVLLMTARPQTPHTLSNTHQGPLASSDLAKVKWSIRILASELHYSPAHGHHWSLRHLCHQEPPIRLRSSRPWDQFSNANVCFKETSYFFRSSWNGCTVLDGIYINESHARSDGDDGKSINSCVLSSFDPNHGSENK